jgi:hypothetical protein
LTYPLKLFLNVNEINMAGQQMKLRIPGKYPRMLNSILKQHPSPALPSTGYNDGAYQQISYGDSRGASKGKDRKLIK